MRTAPPTPSRSSRRPSPPAREPAPPPLRAAPTCRSRPRRARRARRPAGRSRRSRRRAAPARRRGRGARRPTRLARSPRPSRLLWANATEVQSFDGDETHRLGLSSGAVDGTTRQLADGNRIPLLGLGVWQIPDGPECVNAVRWALELGYRHLDTAQAYGNEQSVGEGLRESGVPRDEVFITTKFLPRQQDPAAEAERSLERLGVDRVDLYIVHWPQGGPTWAWPGMERARELGHARSIGVSNFDVGELDAVVAIANQRPTVNQIQLNPFAYRRELLDACARHDIAVEAYSPLGTGRHLANPTVVRIAGRVDRSPAQVLLRWALQHGFIVLPKSTHRDRIEENGALFDFALSDEDMADLDALDRTGGTGVAVESKWWR